MQTPIQLFCEAANWAQSYCGTGQEDLFIMKSLSSPLHQDGGSMHAVAKFMLDPFLGGKSEAYRANIFVGATFSAEALSKTTLVDCAFIGCRFVGRGSAEVRLDAALFYNCSIDPDFFAPNCQVNGAILKDTLFPHSPVFNTGLARVVAAA